MNRQPLSTVATERGLVGGPFGSSLVNADYTHEGIPVIRGTNMSSGRYIGGAFAFVSPEKFARELSRNSAAPRDVIYTQRGTLGQVALVPSGDSKTYVVSQSQMRLRVDLERAVPEFVYYASTTADFLRQIDDRAISTGVPHTNLGILGELEIPLPSLPEQQAIAEVLGALDDKIAANTALAERAEALASSTYDAVVSSWQRVPMSSVLDPILGGTPARARDDYWVGGDQLWVTARDITSAPSRVVFDTAEKITAGAVAGTKAKSLPAGSVILTARGTVGEVARLALPSSFNQSCYGFRPDTLPPGLLYYSILRATERAKAVAHGSVFDTITKATFDHLDVAWDASQAPSAEEAIAPMLDLVAAMIRENRTLAETRDALLPQLMSGKLRVRDAEEVVSEAGA